MPTTPPSDSHARLHAIVHGRVQGVNFRGTTIREAAAHGVTGWVRNLRDGTVEVMAEGTRSQLESLLQFLHVGPPAANVTGVDVQWLEPTGEYNSFRVRY